MAQEALNKIRIAEDEAQAIINTAQIATRDLVREANAKAEKMLADSVVTVKQSTLETLEKAEAEAVQALEAEKGGLLEAIATQKANAEKKVGEASAYIIGRIV